MNLIKETLVGLGSLPSDKDLVKIQESHKMEKNRRTRERRPRQNIKRFRRRENSKLTKPSHLPFLGWSEN